MRDAGTVAVPSARQRTGVPRCAPLSASWRGVERLQRLRRPLMIETTYLPVFAPWAAMVVVVLQLLFTLG
jgi:hypothetical protein